MIFAYNIQVMHSRYIVILFAAMLTLSSGGCSKFAVDSGSGDGIRRTETPVSETLVLSDNRDEEPAALEQRVNELFSQVRIPMRPEDYLLQVINANLDIDQLEEQIIVYKIKSDPEDKIRIMVADFDNVRNTYVIAWQGETQGSNNRSFTVELQDLLGDHIPEILCYGRNSRGEQTLDVFRKTASPLGFGIFFTPVAEISSTGSIEVVERPRSEAYRLLQRNDESFPVAVFEKDPESANINDLIKITHYWSHQDARYKIGKTEKIAGQVIAEKQLADLFAKDADGFEQFLLGPWYRTKSAAASGSRLGEIIHFDPKARKIVFYNGEIQEIFHWQSSYRTIYRGLYINCVNESISTITKQLSISVSGLDTYDLLIKGGEGWDGQYKRLGKDLQNSFLSARRKAVSLSSLQLSGLFRNENGVELFFASPHFTLRENNREMSGGYVIYSFDGEILELKILKENGLVDSTRTYRLSYQEEKRGNQVLRNLTLQPAVVGSSSVEVKTSGSIRLQQIAEVGG